MNVKYPNGQEPNYIYYSKDSKGKKYRYLLGRIEEGKVPAVMICMNPSKADWVQSDQTVNRLINRFGTNGWVMLNLYCGYETDSEEINFNIDKMYKNIEIIRAFFKHGQGREVIGVYTQWGDLTKRELRYCEHEILKILKETNKTARYFGELSKFQNPRHFSRYPANNQLSESKELTIY